MSDSGRTGSQAMARPRTRRRGPGPWLVLLVVASLPAIGLFVGFRWASGQVIEEDAVPVPSSTVVAPPAPDPALSTGLLSVRRFPTIASRGVNLEGFATDAVQFQAAVNDRSCMAISVDGTPVAEKNAEVPVIPASNQKVVVAAAALEILGEDYTYETTVAAQRDPVDGVVDGDLYLVGGGDPLLTSEWYPTSNLELYPVTSPTSLDELADAVRAAGITTVTGSVLGDASRYDGEMFAPGWGTGVAGLEGGPYAALMANDARVLGDPLKANDPAEGAARELLRMLTDRGITVGGSAGVGTAPPDAAQLASVESAPMADVVGEMLINSDNNTAELVVKEIGLVAGEEGSRTAGLAATSDLLTEWGIDTAELVLVDGSGLSLDNRLTCDALIEVLQRFPVDGPLGEGLPVAGENGTLADVFTDHEVAGRMRAKTGTLNNPPFNADPPAAKALAGYVTVDGGSAVEFVLVLNGPTISDQSEYRPIWNQLADLLAGYPSGPTPAELGPR